MITALLVLAGLIGLGLYPNKQKQRTQGDRVRQPIDYYARRSNCVKNTWAKKGTIAAHATGPKQPASSGPTQNARTFGDEINNLNTRVQTTSHPEWKMRYGRALARMAGQLSRNDSDTQAGNVDTRIPDRFSDNVARGDEKWQSASQFTRVNASYQARFRHPGMLQDQPQGKMTMGMGQPVRLIDRGQNPNRIRTVLGVWKQVKYS